MKDLNKFKNEMNLSGQNVYVGHRYVPKIMGEWDKTKLYEPLSIVQYQGASYTSRQYVPVGVELTNEEFWAATGNYNSQIEQYRQDVRNLDTGLKNINDEVVNARNGEETLSDRLDKEQIAKSVLNFGAVGDGVHDDRPAIQAGIDYLHSLGGGTLNLPKGYTFLLKSKPVNTGDQLLRLKSNVNITGGGVVKISDNFGDYHSVFNGGTGLKNVTIKDIIFDENTRGNPMTNLPKDTNNYRSTIAPGRKTENITIENVTINDCVSVWQIITTDCKNLKILNNTINYSKIVPDVKYDRTSIYCGADRAIVSGNTLNGSDFANTAIELHGDKIDCMDNVIDNYVSFMFIVNDQEAVSDISFVNVYDNHVTNCRTGIILWFEFNEINVGSVKIYNNFLETYELTLATYGISGANFTVDNLEFYNNTIKKTGDKFVFDFTDPTSQYTTGVTYNNVIIKENLIYVDGSEILSMNTQTHNPKSFVINNFEFKRNDIFINRKTSESLFTLMSYQGNFPKILISENKLDFNFDMDFIVVNFVLDSLQKTYFIDNIFTQSEPKTIMPIGGNHQPIFIKQKRKSLKIKHIDDIKTEYVKNDSVYYDDNGSTLLKQTVGWSMFKKVNTLKGEFLYTGVNLLTNGTLYKVTKNGYIEDHDITTGNHKKGEYIRRDDYVDIVLKDNNYTDFNDENNAYRDEFFKYLGNRAGITVD